MSLVLLKIGLVLISGGAGVSLIFAANHAFEQEWFNAVVALIGATAFSIVGRMIGSDISELSELRKRKSKNAGFGDTAKVLLAVLPPELRHPPTFSSALGALNAVTELDKTVTTEPANKPTFKEPETAFSEALESGRLSHAADADNYAGNFMYVGTWDGKDSFKNIEPRQYLPNKVNE